MGVTGSGVGILDRLIPFTGKPLVRFPEGDARFPSSSLAGLERGSEPMVCEIATSGGREEAQEVSVQVEVGVFRVGSFELSGAGSALLGDCDA